MLKNNINLIINILIFLVFICLFRNRSIENFAVRQERDERGCPIDITEKESKNTKSLMERIKLNPKTCYADCGKNNKNNCIAGFKCIQNKCRSMGTYACIDAKTGDCREFTASSFNNSDWEYPFQSNFDGFKRYCRYVLNDPNEVYLNYDEIAINGGCPVNNITPSDLNNINQFINNNKK